MNSTIRGYPLGALFVLVTASAVLIAGITPLIRLAVKGEAVGWEYLLAGLCTGVGCGFLVGGALGLLQFHKTLGFALGATAGTLIGGAAGAMAMLPANQMISAAIPMAAGSGLIVGVALLMRRVEEQ
jgi:hypothetical protein